MSQVACAYHRLTGTALFGSIYRGLRGEYEFALDPDAVCSLVTHEQLSDPALESRAEAAEAAAAKIRASQAAADNAKGGRREVSRVARYRTLNSPNGRVQDGCGSTLLITRLV